MNDPIARVVDPFLKGVDAVLDGRYSAVLYGSAARGDYMPGRSDVNLILLIEEASPRVLQRLGGALREWRRTAQEPPLLMTRVEWTRATDVFSIEIADMQTGYKVLRGPDPIRELRVDRADLRRALEREFRGKLVRLRQGYAALAPDTEALGAVAAGTASSVLVLFRSLLVLLGRQVPPSPAEVAQAAAAEIGGNSEALANVVHHRRETGWRCTAAEFEGYVQLVEQATYFLDQLPLGDA